MNVLADELPDDYEPFTVNIGTTPSCEQIYDQTACIAAGCYWYDGACHTNPPPSCEQIYDQTACIAAGCYWYDGACHTNPPPSQFENLSSPAYTHYEVPGEGPFLSIPNLPNFPRVQATLMPYSATCYLQRPLSIGQGDFLLRFSVNAQDLEFNPDPGTDGRAGGYLGVYLTHAITTTNVVAAAYTEPRDGLGFSFRAWTNLDLSHSFLMRTTSYTGAPTANGNWGEFNLTYYGYPGLNTTYDIELDRIGNWPELRIYQAGALIGTIHPRDTTTYQPVQDFTDIQYFCPLWPRGAESAGNWRTTAYGENYQIVLL